MYADRRHTKFDPRSMGLALALDGTIVIGLIAFAAPKIVERIMPEPPIHVIKLAPPTEPPPPVDKVQPKVDHRIPTQKIDTVIPNTIVTTRVDDRPYIAPPTESWSGGSGGDFVEPIKPTPVVIDPVRDGRYAAGFQPDYPASERRAGHQGRVVVRVLIGVDGRVKRVEKVSAVNDAFFEVTERRALDKWRFKPGTRDGVPVEAWQTVGLNFVLHDE
ncbi:MAG: TonB family protein [Sphingomonas sp.]